MLRFDKLKIATSIDHVKKINEKEFEETHGSGSKLIQQRNYRRTEPYLLDIQINYGQGHKYNPNEIVLEFTSKIFAACGTVGLIDRDNFLRIIDIIQPIVAFKDDFNPQKDFEVCKCDVTQDVVAQIKDGDICQPVHMNDLKNHTAAHLKNTKRWICEDYIAGGMVIRNVVKTKSSKYRIAIYHKGMELMLDKNSKYVHYVNNTAFVDGGSIHEYYADTIRIELNINTQKQIRQLLEISDNRICSILGSGARPISVVFNKALVPLKEQPEMKFKTVRELEMSTVIKSCNNDLSKVEAKVRSVCSTNTRPSRIMERYRNLYERMQKPDEKGIDIRQMIE